MGVTFPPTPLLQGFVTILHLKKLNHYLSVKGSREIYLLGLWLNTLGLKLTVTVEE
ncbi:hypothetical protein [Planktothrix paucivesiculata]|uniref:Uncharacterized protein n=1 Tax=Planktothrix paucivesiculata PCC 9631 TaxID=671071 RepID=A0A7Z9BR71_9CYAN|nr:hypothetical protein [Planktothrix paucivesiculata]VXD19057.1 hypothetical protein PL9631_420014 [Planktothrix paucivesiculata PCC 9631]